MKNNKTQPKNWRKVKLGELGRVITGTTPPTARKDFFGKDFPFLTPTDIVDFNVRHDYKTERFLSNKWRDKAEKILIPKNSVCFVCIGSTIGKICFTKENSFTNQQINSIVVNPEKSDSGFVYYLLKQNQVNITKQYGGGGSGKAIINKSTFESIEFSVPGDVNEQKRIAGILSAFDDKIELNNKINRNLEKTAQVIFKEWFIKNPKSKTRSQKFVEAAKIAYGKGPTDNNLKKFGYPVYGANGIIGHYESFDFLDRQIIVGCRGVVGNVTLTLPKCIITHNSLVITPKDNKIFFYYLLKNQNLNAVAGGSAQPQITINDLSQLEIPNPEQKEQEKFEKFVSIIEESRLNIIFENQKLASLRDLLLPKLMSGEIRV